MFFFAAFATVESFLLASMAFDRQQAACANPALHHHRGEAVCALQPSLLCLWTLAIFRPVALTFPLSFCRSSVVNRFFCDIPPRLALSCSDIYTNEIVLFTLAACDTFFALLVILGSYLFIFIAILRMRSSQGRQGGPLHLRCPHRRAPSSAGPASSCASPAPATPGLRPSGVRVPRHGHPCRTHWPAA